MRTSYSLDTGRIQRSQKSLEIPMTPMIDVIFLLLVFFLATSSFQVIEKLLPSNVSQASPAGGQSDDLPPDTINQLLEQVIVKLQANAGSVAVEFNGKTLGSLDDLRSRFQSIAEFQTSLPVIIDPDPSIEAGIVVQAYDWARMAGLSRVYLATQADK